jgi:transcriptional regulator with XRE-family HTH domain
MEPVDYVSVGERIAIYRRRRGLSPVALANLIGRSEAWVSQVERGIRHVDRLSVIIRLAQVLRVTVEDLTGQPLSLAPNGGAEYRAIPALRAALTDYEVIPATLSTLTRDDGPVRDLTHLQRNVDQANRLYQAAHYEEAGLLLSRLIGEAQRATRELPRGDHRAALVLPYGSSCGVVMLRGRDAHGRPVGVAAGQGRSWCSASRTGPPSAHSGAGSPAAGARPRPDR